MFRAIPFEPEQHLEKLVKNNCIRTRVRYICSSSCFSLIARSRFSDRRVERYHRHGRPPTLNALREQALRGQLVPVTHPLDRVHNELVRQLGDKYLSLLDEFRRQHPELVPDDIVRSANGTVQPGPQ